MRFIKFWLVVGAFAFAGCTTTVQLKTEFDIEYAQQQVQPGVNSIRGSALIRQQGGGVVTCAGLPILLIPQSSYAIERVRAIYGNTTKGYRSATAPQIIFTPDDPDYMKYLRKTSCDTQGFFEFPDVADGEFFVTSGIVWMIGTTPQGGALMEAVKVADGDALDLVLSP